MNSKQIIFNIVNVRDITYKRMHGRHLSKFQICFSFFLLSNLYLKVTCLTVVTVPWNIHTSILAYTTINIFFIFKSISQLHSFVYYLIPVDALRFFFYIYRFFIHALISKLHKNVRFCFI